MSFQLHQDVVALTSREYRPYADLNNLLGAFLKAAVKYAHATAGSIKVGEAGKPRPRDLEVFVDQFEEKPPRDDISEDSPQAEAAAIGKESLRQGSQTAAWPKRKACKTVATPILYNKKQIGEVVSSPDQTDMEAEAYQAFQHLFARELAFYIKRYQASQMARKKFGKPMLLVGSGAPMRRVDHFVERAAEVDLPVIISGPFGTEKAHVACAIHFNSQRNQLPLVEVNCRALTHDGLAEDMARYLEKAQGGTLFLNGVDELSLHLQNRLPGFLDSGIGQWIDSLGSVQQEKVRIIASTTAPLDQLVREQRFSRCLLAELDFLKIHLAPLAARREDLPALIDYTLKKYCPSGEIEVGAEALACLQAYAWPENLYELERVVARLATLCEHNVITLDDMRRFAPALVNETEPKPGARVIEAAVVDVAPQAAPVEAQPAPVEPPSLLTDLARHLLRGEFTALPDCHLGLKRALRYMGRHFAEDLCLSELAEQAFMSVSHLSHLFKAEVGESFKTVLTMIRIEKARDLLVGERDMRITDVAFEVGFGDLSHFTKTFKKITGYNPKDYRLLHLEQV